MSLATNEVLVFLDTPDGILGEPARYASGGIRPVTVAVGDVTGSSAADIVVGHTDGRIGILEGRGDGTFLPRGDLSIAGTSPVLDLTSADLDGDGDLDLAVGGSQSVTVLSQVNGRLTALPLVNGDFSQSLQGWTARGHGNRAVAGTVTASNGAARLQENRSFLVALEQTFIVPPSPRSLSFELVGLSRDDAPEALPDAFEVSLLGDRGESLVPVVTPGATSFFNANPNDRVILAPGVTRIDNEITLDISRLVPGTNATVYFDLVGNEPVDQSFAIIDNVRVETDAPPVESLTTRWTDDELASTGAVSHCDVDDDGDVDLVLSDPSGMLIVLANDGTAEFQRVEGAVPENAGEPIVAAAEPAPVTRSDAPQFTQFFVVDSQRDAVFHYAPDGSYQARSLAIQS